ncbi:ATP-binding protein [Lachnoanaerobaculum sp. JCM 36186]|uniref:ATP-binding protein n=1 Tax=Lachnoanaerobaculum sanguinis TaxID=3065809 RepID=UPI002743B09E|nr:ATP-binding protein [Lachnoanaerobaculum sp. JCM 36186]GMO04177.1 ATP-binding protein [Lachnoanaerobaculum sp. JCM 36186]
MYSIKACKDSKIDDLILYRDLKFEDTIRMFCALDKNSTNVSKTISKMLEVAGEYGLHGNLWANILALALAYNENVYSKATEIVGETSGSINTFAIHDFKILRELIQFVPNINGDLLREIYHYEGNGRDSKLVNTRVRDRILRLSKQLIEAGSDNEFKDIITEFYKEYGVGKFGLNKAFRIEEGTDLKTANIIPITRVEHVYLNDIIGYDLQKKKLTDNTESFINGKPANNCLLYGDAGTGKSSSVKAIVNEYYDKGLRIIEIYKHQFRYLSDILEQLKDRNYKFIIYMDDLSFEESELEYKYLKAILEGGFGRRPENVLIYATSNRRHLIRESFRDKTETDEELHTRDTVEEKLSLSARFGEKIYYGSPDKREFNSIVLSLAKKHNIDMDEGEILSKANMWELSHGGMSGRSATQFITYLQSQ